MLRKVATGVCALAFVATLIYFLVDPFPGHLWLEEALIKVPRTHDPDLVGTWSGKWYFLDDPSPSDRETVFHANGTGEWTDDSNRHRPFDWGTEHGVLYTKRLAVDSYSGRRYRYSLLPGGKSVLFSQVKMLDLLTHRMIRK